MNRIQSSSAAEKRIFIWSAAVAALLLFCDQISKIAVERNFRLYETVDLIPGVLNFTSVRNPGAAWSILSGQRYLLLCIGIAAGVLMIRFIRWIAEGCAERYLAVGMVISGIIGNGIDRIRLGVVVDFIHVHWYDKWHYPVFNIADMAICCGVGIFLISNIFRKELGKKEAKADDVSGDDGADTQR